MTDAHKRPLRTLACAAAFSGSLFALPASATDLRVEVNHSRMHTLSQAASTVIVGNPAIADVSISNNNTLVVFGRSYGMTNLIALDATGRQIANFGVNVTGVNGGVITVNRGAEQLSYSCAPRCTRVLDQADDTGVTKLQLEVTKSLTTYGDESAATSSEQN